MSSYSDSDSDNETKSDTPNYNNDIKYSNYNNRETLFSNYEDDDDYIREPDKPKRETLFSNYDNDYIREPLFSNYDDNNDYIREPDKPKRETLFSNYDNDYEESRRMLLHQPKYNEDECLKQAMEESIKIAEDNYFAMQLEKIKREEEATERAIKEVENMMLLEEQTKLSLLESKKEERSNSLKNIKYQIAKLKKMDTYFYEKLITLENIINLYINCEINNYEISSNEYSQIFIQLKNIRVDVNELKLLKEIIIANE